MRIISTAIVLSLAAAVTACGGVGTAQVSEEMRDLLGQPLAKLIGSWGPPTGERVAAGRRLVTWELGPDGRRISGDAEPGAFCNTTVQLNEREIVTGYYWDGNRCGAAASRL